LAVNIEDKVFLGPLLNLEIKEIVHGVND